jgi:hypothetical protein
MELVCYRDLAIHHETRQLAASCYNLAHILLAQSTTGVVFVPIRSMQYLAILDAEEFVFLDSLNKSWIEIAWQNFRPQQRLALDEAVPYEAFYYNDSALLTMQRLQHEFALALLALSKKQSSSSEATILKFNRRNNNPT